MSQRSDNELSVDPMSMLRNMRDANMEAWSKIMQQWVNTDAYAQATGALLDAYLTTSAPFQKLLQQTMTQALTQFNMPLRSDVISLAERLTNIEMRLDDLDAQLSAMQRTVTDLHTAAQAEHLATAEEGAPASAMDPVVQGLSEPVTDTEQSSSSTRSRKAARSKEKK